LKFAIVEQRKKDKTFDRDGAVVKALLSPKSVAERYGKQNSHQNGWVITTTQEFRQNTNNKDITSDIKKLNGES
jgi:hypothetical protein